MHFFQGAREHRGLVDVNKTYKTCIHTYILAQNIREVNRETCLKQHILLYHITALSILN